MCCGWILLTSHFITVLYENKILWALVGATIPSVATGHNWKQGSAASSYLVSIKVYELRIVSHMALFTSLKFSLMKGLAFWLFIERAQHYKSQILIWRRHYPQIRGRVGRVQIGKLLWDTVLPPSGSKLTILQHTHTPLYYIPYNATQPADAWSGLNEAVPNPPASPSFTCYISCVSSIQILSRTSRFFPLPVLFFFFFYQSEPSLPLPLLSLVSFRSFYLRSHLPLSLHWPPLFLPTVPVHSPLCAAVPLFSPQCRVKGTEDCQSGPHYNNMRDTFYSCQSEGVNLAALPPLAGGLSHQWPVLLSDLLLPMVTDWF